MRTLWSRRLVLVGLSLALPASVAACSGSSGSDGGPTSLGPAVSVESSTTAPAPTVAPSTTLAAPVGTATGAEAAQALYDAWGRNDRAAASTVADVAAIDAMWASTPGPYQLYRGCDTGEFDTGGCLFRDRSTNNTIQVDLARRDGKWVVTGAMFSAG